VLRGREGGPFRPVAAFGWALTWAFGAAAGVALGGYLTLVSGSGAPGRQAVDPMIDLVVLPAIAFGVVLVVHLSGQLAAGAIRARRTPQPPGEGDQRGEGDAENRVNG